MPQNSGKRLTKAQRLWILKGIILTRAVDSQLKKLFLSGEITYQGLGFQGKGFRSLGQEAIYAAALHLHKGDLVAPLIRDLGVFLAFTDDVESALNAQVGKSGKPLNGKDLHLGDLSKGVIPAAAPLTISTCTAVGMALGFKLKKLKQVAVSFIGEGGTSLGEWHEAINMAAAQKLPMIFCVENNQTALSTPVHQQSSVDTFADKALGYGMPSRTIDGNDPELIASTFGWAAAHARSGKGPVLIEVLTMRMCGHAHHDDMLYLGYDPPLGFELPQAKGSGYADKRRYAQWAKRDPLATYAAKLIKKGVCTAEDVEGMKKSAVLRCEQAVQVLKERPWPIPDREESAVSPSTAGLAQEAPPFSPKGKTFLDAIAQSLAEIMRQDERVYMIGEDVAPPYGNAFMVFSSLIKEHGSRFINTPISEGAIIGACVGMALAGLRPIGEMQFNDFVASGFNQLVNNAAKLRYRTGLQVPMVLRMPWGGLRRAGPYHSQDTIPWFYRTPGLKIVVPSTPFDACGLLKAAMLDADPVLFYEHIALYRDPKIKQLIPENMAPLPLGLAAVRSSGTDLTLLSYGAYVHCALEAARVLEVQQKASCEVIDLRSLVPLDWETIAQSVHKTGKVLLVGEDTRVGSVLESIAAMIGERCFRDLDAPVTVLGSQHTPIPYSPPLEDAYLLSLDTIIDTALALLEY